MTTKRYAIYTIEGRGGGKMTTLVDEVAKRLCMADHDGVLVWDRMEDLQGVWLEEARQLIALIQSHPETMEQRGYDYMAGVLEGSSLPKTAGVNVIALWEDYIAREKGREGE